MTTRTYTVRFGTRGSDLALWQTNHVASLLQAAHPHLHIEHEIIKTRGDRIVDTPLPLLGGKGLFTAELEIALYDGRIDCAVHSLKDLPTDEPAGLVVGAIPARANPADVLVSRGGHTLATLPKGARVGTSSYRRGAQLLHSRPDLRLLDIRGNVDTRIRKALDPAGDYDAIVLAHAGLERLGHLAAITQVLDFETMLPAPGQGALAIQCRDEATILELLSPIQHTPTLMAVGAERAFLAGLGGGCSVPVAAYGNWQGDTLVLRGRVCSRDGAEQIEVANSTCPADVEAARSAGAALAKQALEHGAHSLLEQGG